MKLASFLLAGLLGCAATLHAGRSDNKLDIYWIDSEGGGSTLIVTPTDQSILVDAGNPGGRDAKRIHHVATQVARLKQIDYLVVTHFHIDHFGGAAELAQLLPIRHIYDKGVPEKLSEDPTFPLKIKPYQEIKAAQRTTVSPGWTIPLDQPAGQRPNFLNIVVLAANQQFIRTGRNQTPNPLAGEARRKEVDTTDNANSIVLLVRFGNFRFFDGGDLTWNAEADLVTPVNRVGSVDVYQSNHHGLDVSNNPLLIRSITPTVAVLNNGPTKGAEKETMSTLTGLSGLQAIYQVHKNVRPNAINAPDAQIANLEQKCEGHYIKLAVEPDGASYTISIPATGHSRTFQTQSRSRRP